ncbi:type II secretion system protein [Vibrio intestinalis]|uniref:type II secretion system protein n=1 Tax=Vibrio intestinalis TaxID=2933291 RepID=UPI0021A755BE|nr:type II secretion system protein [Vibrio intestinalis]
MRKSGFSLIELVVVIVMLSVLAISASSYYINLQSQARVAVLENVLGSIKTLNTQVGVMSHLDYVKVRQDHSEGSRLQYLDLNRDGVQQEDQGEWSLIWGYLDNTHMPDAIILDEKLVQLVAGRAEYYVGFDRDGTGSPLSGACWVRYAQPDFDGDEPAYGSDFTGC